MIHVGRLGLGNRLFSLGPRGVVLFPCWCRLIVNRFIIIANQLVSVKYDQSGLQGGVSGSSRDCWTVVEQSNVWEEIVIGGRSCPDLQSIYVLDSGLMVDSHYLILFEAVNRISKTHWCENGHKYPNTHRGEDNALKCVVSWSLYRTATVAHKKYIIPSLAMICMILPSVRSIVKEVLFKILEMISPNTDTSNMSSRARADK